MNPILYDRGFNTRLGELNECLRGIVIEERNGMFELEIDYSIFSENWDKLQRGNIIVVDANDTLNKQKFRIYKLSKVISGRFTIFAKHISYDLARDMIEGLNIDGQSCEYCLNEIFKASQFSNHYKGYSNIINTQKFSVEATKVLTAIAGEEGSILDTFGNGADLLRDNEKIYVLNSRGHDNSVTIEYSKNLTGIEITEDDSEMITRIRAIAKYLDEENNEVIVHTYIDSNKINLYETPYIEEIDFSSYFEENEIPTKVKLKTLGEYYFRDKKCDIPKTTYKINFVPLSKCVGYEMLDDKISLCDTVSIKDHRYGIDTQVKVIKATYNFLKERYDSMELGEPKTSLGDIIGGNSVQVGPQGPAGKDGKDANIEDLPNTLPATPILEANIFGFASISLEWSFDNKLYYQYELYASKEKDFTPNTFNLIFAGQASTFLHQVKPNETWYYKVCCINSHGNRTEFSKQIKVVTAKIDDLSNYVDKMAINDALIGELSLDRGWVGQLKGNWIDAKQLSVTDGNGKRTFNIDSFGNVFLDVNTFKINSENINDIYATKASLTQEGDKIIAKFESAAGYNLIENSTGMSKNTNNWTASAAATIGASYTNQSISNVTRCLYLDNGTNTNENFAFSKRFKLKANTKYTLSGYFLNYTKCPSFDVFVLSSTSLLETDTSTNYTNVNLLIDRGNTKGAWKKYVVTFTTPANTKSGYVRIDNNGYNASGSGNNRVVWNALMLTEGELDKPWSPHPNEVYNGNTQIDGTGVTVFNGALRVNNNVGTTVLEGDSNGNLTLSGTVKSTGNDGRYVSINGGGITFKDSQKNEEVGRIAIASFSENRDINGVSIALPKYGDYFRFSSINKESLEEGWSSTDTQYTFFDLWSGDQNVGSATYKKGINIYAPLNIGTNGIKLKSGNSHTSDIKGNISWNSINGLLGLVGDNGCFIGYKDGDSIRSRMVLTEAAHPGTGDHIKSWGNQNFSGYTFHNAHLNALTLTVSGSKNCVQETNNYGNRLINAYETAEYYFGDLGEGKIIDGECVVYIDDIFEECINLDYSYHVFTQIYNGEIHSIERYRNYFIVKGTEGTVFSWELKAKRLGYENDRLEVHNEQEFNDELELIETDLLSNEDEKLIIENLLDENEVLENALLFEEEN